jgi:ferric enterobactin receptor
MKPKKITAHILFIITLLLIAIKPAKAQTNNCQVSGMVIDSVSQKPLDYITVNLKTDKGAFIKAAITKNGAFTFTSLRLLKYTVTLTAIGYQPKTITVADIDSVKKTTDLGIIRLNSNEKQLKEVAITGDKPIIKQEVDRIIYDLQADPESKGSNLLEMLRKVPFVSLDADENILLKGQSSYKILINGKPSSMMERDPINILRSIPASTIQRIEIITNPPAKYDAEGFGGIINIITNKKIDNGYNGTLNINSRFPGNTGIGTSFTVKEGKLGISGFGGASINSAPVTTSLNTRTTDTTNLVQRGNGTTHGKNGYFGTEISYEIDSLNLISGQFNINGNNNNGNSNQVSSLTGQSGILQGYNLGNINNGHGNGLDASLNYQLGFKRNKSELLTFSYRYYNNYGASTSNLTATNRIKYNTPNYNQVNNSFASEQTFQLDYVRPLKKWNIEAGIKGIFRDNRSNFQYDSLNTNGNFDLDAPLSNKYNSTQNIYAAYNTWQYTAKKWGIKAGVRIEQNNYRCQFCLDCVNCSSKLSGCHSFGNYKLEF